MKPWTIALKDTLIAFRDRNAILLMIAAPLMISMIMGAAFGNMGGNTSPISEISLIIVNADKGELGKNFTEIISSIDVESSEGIKPLFAVEEYIDKDEAIAQVEIGKARGVLYIPVDFSTHVENRGESVNPPLLEVYTDPSASISPGIIRGVVQRIVNGFNTISIGNNVAVEQIFENLDENSAQEIYANLENLEEIIIAENESFGKVEGRRERIIITSKTLGAGEDLDLLGYFVPSMSIFFLMFAAFEGTRSILEEERDGTLHRLMITPTSIIEILLGKIGGTFLTGILQFVILVAISALLFGVHWSDSLLPLILLTIVTVIAVTSLGAFLAGFSRNANQAGILGSTLNLVFAILGGNFILTTAFPDWLTIISKLTVNRWALDGFSTLALSHGTLINILPNIAALLGMAIFYFTLATVLFKRRFIK
ncbi:MAG: ABC transporter permease [Anaerolineae bacterium]|jgi:ABC-2 type transport system permease protein|nr:ABC transporter permease [Anaerolineae bacterium]MBT7073579.1 ABC transporter permease [Anaerolineae bacterium]MBT7782125.1 ABC transporter permease [Anaerolineae bacterium]